MLGGGGFALVFLFHVSCSMFNVLAYVGLDILERMEGYRALEWGRRHV